MASTIDLNSLKSRTTKHTRREQWGDLARAIGTNPYPRQPAQQIVHTVLQQLDKDPNCNSLSNKPADPTVAQKLDQLNVPQGQRCLASAALLFQKSLGDAKVKDRRSKEYLASLNRTQRAKKHLDRARQMYWFAVGLMRKGIDTLRTAENHPDVSVKRRLTQEGNADLNKAKHLVSQTTLVNGQQHVDGKTSALKELLEAYRLVRDYEMNPLPPLNDRGEPNVERWQEDEAYVKIMGSDRLEPNRLGIGPQARAVWLFHQHPDPNYYTDSPVAADFKDTTVQQPLYHNVSSSSDLGPQQWVAYEDFIVDKFGLGPSTSHKLPTVSLLRQGGYWSHALKTDSGRALSSIHQNFHPPLPEGDWQLVAAQDFQLLNGRQIQTASMQPHVPLPSSAVPGEINNNPRWRGEPARYYPTGPPELGVPSGNWDGRVACAMLQSQSGKTASELLKCREQQQLDRVEQLNRLRPDELPAISPLGLWKESAPSRVSNTPILQSRNPDILQEEPLALNFRRTSAVDRSHIAFDSKRPVLQQTTIPEEQKALQDKDPQIRWKGTEYRYGVPQEAVPVQGRPQVVGDSTARYNAMLQHALFLLGAPPTLFLQSKLPASWFSGVPLQYQRNSQGGSVGRPGWLTLEDPFVQGSIPGNLGYPRIREAASSVRLAAQNNLVEVKSQPLGPFSLDEEFGTVGHLPGPNYRPEDSSSPTVHHGVWLVRTNQQNVYGGDTLGLDFW